MEEIRRTKIKEAMKETLNVYEKLDLNMTEIEIVSRSQNVAAKVNVHNCPPLVDNKAGEPRKRGEHRCF